jgi:hypothetical protein
MPSAAYLVDMEAVLGPFIGDAGLYSLWKGHHDRKQVQVNDNTVYSLKAQDTP